MTQVNLRFEIRQWNTCGDGARCLMQSRNQVQYNRLNVAINQGFKIMPANCRVGTGFQSNQVRAAPDLTCLIS